MPEPARNPAEFDFRTFVRDFLESSGEPDPRKLAAEIVDAVPVQCLRAALHAAAPDLVRELARQRRTEAYRANMNASSRMLAPGPSARWLNRVRAVSIFQEREHTGTEWKLLGECTADDLLAIAGQYRRREAENATHARRREVLAVLLKRKRGAKVVSDLPEGTVRDVLAGA